MVRILIDRKDFQSEILDIVTNEKFNDVFSNQSEEFKQGVIQGLFWASLLTNQLHEYVLGVNNQ